MAIRWLVWLLLVAVDSQATPGPIRRTVSAMARTGLCILGSACAACPASAADTAFPMSYLRTFGPAADPATRLNWGLMAISIFVTVLICALLLWASLRR